MGLPKANSPLVFRRKIGGVPRRVGGGKITQAKH